MKRPIVIGLMVHKGGVGKTVSSVCIADQLALKGKKVLLIDCDEQSNLKTIFGIKLSDKGAEGGLAGILLEDINPTNVTVEVRKNIDLILSGGRLIRDLEKKFSNTPDSEQIMRIRFEEVIKKSDYDFIILDAPPAISLISANIVCFADHILMPCSPDLLSLVGVKNTVSFLESLISTYKGKKISNVLGVFLTQSDLRRTLDLSLVDDLDNLYQQDLLGGGKHFHPIRNDIKIRTSQVRRKLLSEAFPTAKANEDYSLLVDQIIAELKTRASETKVTKSQKNKSAAEVQL